MWRDREDELDFAHVERQANAATHRSKDRIAGALAQATCCAPSCERLENAISPQGAIGSRHVLHLPEDAHWNAEQQAVEFGVEIKEHRGVVRVPRRMFQRLLPERPTPERCVEAYYLQRTRFESIAERKLRRRQLTEDGNVEISGRDLR